MCHVGIPGLLLPLIVGHKGHFGSSRHPEHIISGHTTAVRKPEPLVRGHMTEDIEQKYYIWISRLKVAETVYAV